ncbi:Undecaprenyl-phosphate galactose phosphotransferase WbaP [Sphaerotilus hippei]|uniref:Undecaprenyl-phosphate galactose phosphotransferase WbaP n=1 Tax=Sphaerotilus hippei TaxID=744406 RepID=A0A318HCS2_9BURK|nr:sugar transferase [Sphaerotilus hippei]PXW97071.1 Undecaprenyl-phosphate galactose phosphotransferase WbaP [Sphaerotilus hippei]
MRYAGDSSATNLARVIDTDHHVEAKAATYAAPSATVHYLNIARQHSEAANRTVGLTKIEHFFKRTFDVVGVLAILALFAPLMIAVALAVRLTTGKQIIYGHTRLGRGGREFKCYKFRSMVTNSEQVLKELLATDPAARAEWDRDFKLKNDPRITKVGRFIRKTSLDELPQLWNVLVGDMSIVGPRPVVRTEFDRYYGAAREHYLSVPPGLTGLWQVSGRNDLDYDQRVALDRQYVETWNLVTDLSIVLRTAKVMVARSGAY